MSISEKRQWQLERIEKGICSICNRRKISQYAEVCNPCAKRRRDSQRSRRGLNPKRGRKELGRPLKLKAPEWDKVDWGKRNADIARELGVSSVAVGYQRKKRGKEDLVMRICPGKLKKK